MSLIGVRHASQAKDHSGLMPKKPNNILKMDLKFFNGTPLLWMIDAYTRFAVGKVLKNKEMDEEVKQAFMDMATSFREIGQTSKQNNTQFLAEIPYYGAPAGTDKNKSIIPFYNSACGDEFGKIHPETS